MAKQQDLSSKLRFMSSREACEILSVTSQTLRRWAKTGRIPAIRTPGGRYRYDLSGLIVARDASPTAAAARHDAKAKPKKPRSESGQKLPAFIDQPNVPAPPAQVDLEEAIAMAAATAPDLPTLNALGDRYIGASVNGMAVSPEAIKSRIEQLALSSRW